MQANTSRLPSTLKEHPLFNRLLREHSALNTTNHCESHYDFRIIDALQTYVDRYDGVDLNLSSNAFWMSFVAKLQRLAPDHAGSNLYSAVSNWAVVLIPKNSCNIFSNWIDPIRVVTWYVPFSFCYDTLSTIMQNTHYSY